MVHSYEFKQLKVQAKFLCLEPAPHPSLVGAVLAAELPLQVLLLPKNDAAMDHEDRLREGG